MKSVFRMVGWVYAFCCPPTSYVGGRQQYFSCPPTFYVGGRQQYFPCPPTLLKNLVMSILAVVLLSGCGFHLRGASGFDFSYVHIKSASANKIAQDVIFRMKEEGVQIVPTADAAQAVVFLRDEAIDKRLLTVSSISGRQIEFELNYRVDLEVQKPDGTVLLEKQRISLLRDYLFDETAVLAMGAEDEMLRKEMFREIVAQIIRRLQILKLGKVALTQIAFEGLKAKYRTGEPLVLDLIEKSTRFVPVDIWLTLSVGDSIWFVTLSEKEGQPWQLSQEVVPLRRNVPTTKTRHRLLDFTVPPKLALEYILRAVYTEAGVKLDLNNLSSTMVSIVAEGKMVFEEEK
jgi:LPS-assembly lipoprotein